MKKLLNRLLTVLSISTACLLFSQASHAQGYSRATMLEVEIPLKHANIQTQYFAKEDKNNIWLAIGGGSHRVDGGAWLKTTPFIISYNISSFSKIGSNVFGFLAATQFNDCIKSAIASDPNRVLLLQIKFKAGSLDGAPGLNNVNLNFNGSNFGLEVVNCAFTFTEPS